MCTKILVIDDSPMLRQFIARSLKQHTDEYEVVAAHDGDHGLALLELEAPDLILLDFMLPGKKGDEICQTLATSPSTSHIPVVLMSGSPRDLERTAASCSNVVKSIAKPFTPELLCATVGGVVRTLAETTARKSTAPIAQPIHAAEVLAASPSCDLKGHTRNFPLHRVLLAIEESKGTGVLRLFPAEEPTLLYFRQGQALLATTKDVSTYLGPNVHLVPKSMQEEQSATGCPLPLVALAHGEVERQTAIEQSRLGGAQLFASAWASSDMRFEFESLGSLPDWLQDVTPFPGPISKWALECLREIHEIPPTAACQETAGIPAYTRCGYERISRISLNSEERNVIRLVDNRRSIADIATELGISLKKAQSILFRFLCLEIIDHWPATVLRRA